MREMLFIMHAIMIRWLYICNVCMYHVCLYVCMYVCMQYACMYVRAYVCVYVCCVSMNLSMHVHVHAYAGMAGCMHVLNACIYIQVVYRFSVSRLKHLRVKVCRVRVCFANYAMSCALWINAFQNQPHKLATMAVEQRSCDT